MIKKIYSKVNPSLLLSVIYSNKESLMHLDKTEYTPITEPTHCLQAILIDIPEGTNVKPHKHNPQERITNQTHEAALIFKGSAELSIYDIDNTFVEKITLNAGDCSVIINGGHSLKTLKPTVIFEFKNGPYYGPEKDKTTFN